MKENCLLFSLNSRKICIVLVQYAFASYHVKFTRHTLHTKISSPFDMIVCLRSHYVHTSNTMPPLVLTQTHFVHSFNPHSINVRLLVMLQENACNGDLPKTSPFYRRTLFFVWKLLRSPVPIHFALVFPCTSSQYFDEIADRSFMSIFCRFLSCVMNLRIAKRQ